MFKFLLALSLLCSASLFAGDASQKIIDSLTQQIEKETDDKKLSDLYLRRAIEGERRFSTVLSERRKVYDQMINDVKKSQEHNPQNIGAALCRAQIIMGSIGDSSLENALKLANRKDQKSRVHQILAESHYQVKEIGQAIIHCDKAIENDKENKLDLLLFRSHLYWKNDQPYQRILFLTKAKKKNPSMQLQTAFIDALIDYGKHPQVKKTVHKAMDASKFKSSWLIRAALLEAKSSKARNVYANAAVAVIRTRLDFDRPDVTLLMELARAYAILEDFEKAEFYVNKALQKPHDRYAMNELKAKIKPPKKAKN